MKLSSLCSALLFSSFAFANGGTAHYDVVAVEKAPDLNAPYNAQYWAEIPAIAGGFHYPWRDVPVPKTTFQAAHDNENLYMVFTAKDPNILSPATDDNNERSVGKGDRVEVFFAPQHIEKPAKKGLPLYYGFEIAPNGKVMDYSAEYYRHLNFDWNAEKLKTNGEIKDGEYVVRIQIPLEELKKLNLIKDDNTIQAGVFRAEFVPDGDKVDQRWASWVNPNTAKPDFHVNSAFGEFRLLQPTK